MNALALLLLLIDGALIYAVTRRHASRLWAAIAGVVFVFNPATVDSAYTFGPIAPAICGLGLIGYYGLVRNTQSKDTDGAPWFAIGAVALLGAAALLIAQYFGTLHVDSVDAYNLWTVKNAPGQPDAQAILYIPQFVWGAVLFLAAVALVVARNLTGRNVRTLLESGVLLGLAFALLPTRGYQHDMIYGLALLAVAMPFAKRYVTAYVVLSFSLLVGVFRAQELPAAWGNIQHGLSFVNVAVFFALGYIFLGQEPAADTADAAIEAATVPERKPLVVDAPANAEPFVPTGRSWFDPSEGVAYMRPLDYIVAFGITLASFLVMFYRYWFPEEKIFDEIYFARAAEEYLKRQYIYENTHPPATKLLITLSTLLHGGLVSGDNSAGWRWMGVVFAALAVWMLYALAKRITRSTLFSAYAAGLLALDGMHFVQARIATPETYVVFFATATIYTFYRFWTASQVRVERRDDSTPTMRIAGIVASLLLGLGVTFAFFRWQVWPVNAGSPQMVAASIAAVMLYFAAGFYLLYRLVIEPKIFENAPLFSSYPDGTRTIDDGANLTTLTSDGARLDRKSKPRKFVDVLGLRITYGGDGSVQYDSPDGSARYDANTKPDNALLWLFLFSLSIGLLVTSKWYGVMAYGVAFVVVLGVWSQRYWSARRPATWGNPFGFRLDIVAAVVVFVTMSVYWSAYIPTFMGLSDSPGLAPRPYTVNDVVTMQYNAYEYHKNLVATHPYASLWYQWPLDYKPILYYAKYGGSGKNTTAGMIYSLPNPFIMWMGLLSVPWIGFLAYRERNKGYALLVITYLAQWLPWALSPRIAFLYHFYVNIPVICLCNALLAQRVLKWGDSGSAEQQLTARIAVGLYFAIVLLAFIYFYPILSGTPISTDQWMQRMWFGRAWI
jgi:dolichyl-phosphate-mannose--protein O-mannosyl transferase